MAERDVSLRSLSASATTRRWSESRHRFPGRDHFSAERRARCIDVEGQRAEGSLEEGERVDFAADDAWWNGKRVERAGASEWDSLRASADS